MRFGSICSGIEAASAAWNPLGWEAEFFAEIVPVARWVGERIQKVENILKSHGRT